MPVFFRGNMSECESMLQGERPSCSSSCSLKTTGCGWISTAGPGMSSIWSSGGAAPSLCAYPGGEEAQGRRDCSFRLRFAYEEYRDLSLRDEPLDRRLALAVDLGINNDAVCSVMAADGAILGRRFINFPREKDG